LHTNFGHAFDEIAKLKLLVFSHFPYLAFYIAEQIVATKKPQSFKNLAAIFLQKYKTSIRSIFNAERLKLSEPRHFGQLKH
jgi:hypothetical protein